MKNIFDSIKSWIKPGKTNPALFDILYKLKKDPWKYKTSEYEQEKYRETLKVLSQYRYKRILEVGCAEGVFTGMMAEYADKITALDVSKTALKRAGENNCNCENIEFCLMNIEEETPGGKFDLVVCSEVLYYLDTRERVAGVRDRLTGLLENKGKILLVHMRLLAEDESGCPTPVTGLPRIGGKTVHGVFNESENLELIFENKKPLYMISMFEKM